MQRFIFFLILLGGIVQKEPGRVLSQGAQMLAAAL
jgi:hypothetical protein